MTLAKHVNLKIVILESFIISLIEQIIISSPFNVPFLYSVQCFILHGYFFLRIKGFNSTPYICFMNLNNWYTLRDLITMWQY